MSDLTKVKAELEPEQGQVDLALAAMRQVVISTEPGLTWAGDMLKHAKGRAKELEEKRTSITKPLMQAKSAVDALFKPLIDRYGQAEIILKGKIAEYTARVENERRAVMQASAEEYQAGGNQTAIIPEPAKVEGVSIRKVWDFEITDPGIVPRDYCVPAPTLIRSAVHLGAREIPGVRIFERDHVAARVK